MAFRNFDIRNVRGLEHASGTELPNLVVIAGPNGSGKSTLLYELYQQRVVLAEPETRVSYLGPHRGWRRTSLGGSALGEFQPSLSAYLETPSVPPWRQYVPQGLQGVVPNVPRDPSVQEEAFSFVKSSILKLDGRLQTLLRQVWEDQDHRINPDDVPDLLDPLRRIVRALLPHLELESIDVTDETNLEVMFHRVDGSAEETVELDDLSSGEKAVVGLLLPLVESQVERLLESEPAERPMPTSIIDEPESHLHPALQVLLVEQLAEVAVVGERQFILATQSPTVVDAVDDEALFVLAPRAAVSTGNQLIPIGRSQPKLEAMRSLTGSTHLLTRCRPIIFIEGERPVARPVADQRLIELLIPEARGGCS